MFAREKKTLYYVFKTNLQSWKACMQAMIWSFNSPETVGHQRGMNGFTLSVCASHLGELMINTNRQCNGRFNYRYCMVIFLQILPQFHFYQKFLSTIRNPFGGSLLRKWPAIYLISLVSYKTKMFHDKLKNTREKWFWTESAAIFA